YLNIKFAKLCPHQALRTSIEDFLKKTLRFFANTLRTLRLREYLFLTQRTLRYFYWEHNQYSNKSLLKAL
ncbi:hypothetical protein, partial [Flavobacterium sp.]|uniref:hypothetical protein n=1 Tax=Flavobacterium sp. TaxID=239 RepID=UPI002EDB1E43